METVKIYVIDNGGQWTHREWRTLRYLGVDAQIVPNTTPLEDLRDVAALVLSGGAPRIGYHHHLGNCTQYLDHIKHPILGICAGHQLMAEHFGGTCAPATVPEFGKVEITIEVPDEILQGVPSKTIVWESHNDEIKHLPSTFMTLASSPNCSIQAIKHRTRPLYGLQFHPEVEHTEHGKVIFRNFIEITKKHDREDH